MFLVSDSGFRSWFL